MIIETSDNRFYRVTEWHLDALAHLWCGDRVKRVNGEWISIAKTLPSGTKCKEPVRKIGCRIVELA